MVFESSRGNGTVCLMTFSEAKDDTSLQRTGNLLPFITNIRLSTGMIKQCLELSSNLQRPFLNTNNLAYVFLSEDVY